MPAKKTAPKKTADKTPKAVADKTPKAVADKTPKAVADKTPKAVADKTPKAVAAKAPKAVEKGPKIESTIMIQGAKFVKVPFFVDIKKDDLNGKHKLPEKPTACSRPKVNGVDSKNLVEQLSQQLEFENKTYFEGCEGQICTKCNINFVDQKFYVDKSLGYCTDCAALLGLGQSKEGVFSDAQMELQMELMRRSMENVKNEDDIESVLGEMDNLELEDESIFAEEEDSVELNS
jgi:hypothetical protein